MALKVIHGQALQPHSTDEAELMPNLDINRLLKVAKVLQSQLVNRRCGAALLITL
jgi:hypothetical protein